MDGYYCPACAHPVPPAAWAEATSMTEAVLGRNVQSDWIEMRRCPSCELLLRRAADEQWHPAPPRLLAALQSKPPGRENGNLWSHRLAAHATADVRLASRESRDEVRASCAEPRGMQEGSPDIRRAVPSREQRDRLARRS